MSKAKTKAATTAVPVPQNDAQAEQLIARLGALQRDKVEAEARHNAQVAALETPHGEFLAGTKRDQEAIVEALNVWATANRDRLTNGGRTKTVQLASGKVFWREGSPSIAWGKLKHAEVVERIQARMAEITAAIGVETKRSLKEALRRDHSALLTFLQTTVKPSKEAMGDRVDLAVTIPGIVLVRPGESFNVEPLASQISEVAS